jgi:thiol-disulfide isomerase/thioredoxin
MKKKPSRHGAKRNTASGHGKQSTSPRGGPSDDRRNLYILAAAIAAIAGFATMAIIAYSLRDTGHIGGTEAVDDASASRTGLSRLVKVSPPQVLTDITFEDGDGKPHNLSEWKGKVVLLNIWATWCAPCRLEMPSLARLQAKLGSEDFVVVAVSQDRGGPAAPRSFLATAGLTQLGLFVDPSGKLTQTIKAPGMPLTVLIDREGRQVARLAGPAEWDSREAEAVIRAMIAEHR